MQPVSNFGVAKAHCRPRDLAAHEGSECVTLQKWRNAEWKDCNRKKNKRVKQAGEREWEVRGCVKESQSASERRKISEREWAMGGRKGVKEKTMIQSNIWQKRKQFKQSLMQRISMIWCYWSVFEVTNELHYIESEFLFPLTLRCYLQCSESLCKHHLIPYHIAPWWW